MAWLDTDARLASYEKLCRDRGLAMTVQRRVILAELVGRQDHPTADDIYDSVRERLPGLSRTTVYRVLDTLVQVGAARKVFHPDAVVRFDPICERHHHLVCEHCRRLFDLEASQVEGVPFPRTRSGFRIRDYSIIFTGTCKECRTNKEEKRSQWQN
jgi:Fur family peroxide stress response transcriptional regulator